MSDVKPYTTLDEVEGRLRWDAIDALTHDFDYLRRVVLRAHDDDPARRAVIMPRETFERLRATARAGMADCPHGDQRQCDAGLRIELQKVLELAARGASQVPTSATTDDVKRLADYATELENTVKGGGTLFAPRDCVAFAAATRRVLSSRATSQGGADGATSATQKLQRSSEDTQ